MKNVGGQDRSNEKIFPLLRSQKSQETKSKNLLIKKNQKVSKLMNKFLVKKKALS